MNRVLTPKGEATRARIVTGAARVLREKGVATATLDEICSRTGVSKGQLFHYFPGGREDLLLAVAQHEATRVLDDQQPYLGSLDTWEAWQQWRDVVVERYTAQGDTCPMGSLFSEVGRSTPGARAIVIELMREWQEYLASGIRALRRTGRLPASLDIDEAAAALLAGIQGGVAIMLSTGQPTHLEAALDWGISRLRAAGQLQQV
ncbi:TetR/AcrR family transcriptional regulator [Streptomyces sp. NBC_01190]|uniref:TetR/AcrR family transcriptional regulator n=1 Tax=Streptomyces sp. NBC_01190 TaxID=2903767 RepID=UPI00386B3A4C|nr:TetR/AcrR family transcriptional regulator [Streptomyces sp. NBC_01190]